MIRGIAARRRNRDEEHENPAWPALVDLFAFGMVVMLLLWVQALPEPPKPPPPAPDPRLVGLSRFLSGLETTSAVDFVWDPKEPILRLIRFRGREIYFDSGRFDLAPEDIAIIRAVARDLSKELVMYPQVVVVVSGTADPSPLVRALPPRDNVELSALRAAEVSRVLVDEGFRQKLQVVGLGETGDAAGKSAEQMQMFRQVFIELKWFEAAKATKQS